MNNENNGEKLSDRPDVINDPFANMNREKNEMESQKKKTKLIVIVFSVILVILIGYILIDKSISSSKQKEANPQPKENLTEVSEDLQEFITLNDLDALDTYGHNELLRVAINHVCSGVYDCSLVSGDEVKNYVKTVFNKDVELTDVNCEFADGVLYKYDSQSNRYVLDGNHKHTGYSTEPIYTKLNSIKKRDDKYILVLNKLYYNESKSENITSDALGVYKVYSFYDYDMPTDNGAVIDMSKLTSDYEENFSKLKNRGVRYQYTFVRDGKKYYLDKYEIIKD